MYGSCAQQHPLYGEISEEMTIGRDRNSESHSRKENQDGPEKTDKSMY